MIHRFTIDGTLPGLNEYTEANRKHHRVGAKMKKRAQEAIDWQVLSQLGRRRITRPVYIRYRWYEKNRRRDPDNVAFAKKFINDSLVTLKILPNDGWANVVGFSDAFDVDKDNPRIVVELEEVGDDGQQGLDKATPADKGQSAL